MSAAPLRVTHQGGVATLTLDRPERGNALGPDLVEALHAALQACHAEPSLHTLVLRGAGRHFCTGLDLSDLPDPSDLPNLSAASGLPDPSSPSGGGDGELLRRLVRIELLLDAVWRSPLRTVAIAQGRAWGAGADLFAACERRAAQSGATFRFPGARFGFVLGTRRLAERLGAERARRAVIDGLELDAAPALASGLATESDDPVAPAAGERLAPPAVDPATARALRAATRPDADALADHDLAALVRSAARPGLLGRIHAYRDSLRQAH